MLFVFFCNFLLLWNTSHCEWKAPSPLDIISFIPTSWSCVNFVDLYNEVILCPSFFVLGLGILVLDGMLRIKKVMKYSSVYSQHALNACTCRWKRDGSFIYSVIYCRIYSPNTNKYKPEDHWSCKRSPDILA